MPPSASTAEPLDNWNHATSPAFLRRLDRLRINVRGGTTHHPGGNPVATATQDSGLEFSKHRDYVPGDDLRHIDWNALARHDTKLIKTFRAEREAPLHLLIDTSASMGIPADDSKLPAAAALAIGLAYISLRNRDPVRVAAVDQTGAHQLAPLLRHPNRLQELSRAILARVPSGATDLERGVEMYLHLTRLPGIAIVLSDFLVAPEQYRRALHRLQASGYAVAAVRIIGEREKDPFSNTKRVRLFDVETQHERIIDLTAANRELYRKALARHLDELRTWCDATAIPFCLVDTTSSPSSAMTATLPKAGILR
jgi:uncharacterized protein (DUF58 family)